MTNNTEKTGGPALGNAIAYFVIVLWAKGEGYIAAEDTEEAVLMAGAIIGTAVMYLRNIVHWVGGLIDKIADRKPKG